MLWEFYFLFQAETQADSVGEATFFVVSAETADGINDPVFLPEGLAVHSLVGFLKDLSDLVLVRAVVFIISVVAHFHDAVSTITLLRLQSSIRS